MMIQPEMEKIQKKYKDKKDQESLMKQQQEIQDLYDKYGKDIDIELNFDAYKDDEDTPRYENIGWLSLNDFKKAHFGNEWKLIKTESFNDPTGENQTINYYKRIN